VLKPEQRVCLSRASRIRGHRSRWSEACISEISTAQYLFPPLSAQKKPSTTYPKRPPIRLPHHQCADPGADSLNSPHLRMNCADLVEDSCPGRISDHVDVLAPSRHSSSQASCHRGKQRPSISHTKRNPTCAPAMGQDYPIIRPSPGDNRPIYPSFPALASRRLPEGRIPKSHESFFFLLLT
jgi:hypothetical protein